MGITLANGMDADFKRAAVINGKLVSFIQAQSDFSGGSRVRV